MKSVRSAYGTLAVAVVLAACGAGSTATSTTVTTTSSTTTTTTTTQPTTTTAATSTTTTVDPDLPPASLFMTFVQLHLRALGYFDGGVDGIPGPLTVAAIQGFQEDAGITVDGEFGPETQQALAAALQGNEDFIEGIQEGLTELGLYDGPIDGSYGAGTKAAVSDLQESCDIEANGAFTVRTHVCLDEALKDGGD